MATAISELTPRIPPQSKVSFEEYIEWLDEDTRAEWVDGEIKLMASPASIDHQTAGNFLNKILSVYVEEKGLGQVIIAPYVMKLAYISRGREPDVLFVQTGRLHLLTRNYLDGPADLVIEIVSPESEKRDRKVKFAEYQVAGIREYWLIDPDKQTAEFFQLDEDGMFQCAALDKDGLYQSKVVTGFRLRVDWLWQTPKPTTLDVMRELKVL
jgi:Uma2 family endonuclease